MRRRRERDGDGGVDVRAAHTRDGSHGDEDGKRPTRSDDDPAGALAFGFGEQDIRNDAVAEEDQQQRAYEFAERGSHATKVIPPPPSMSTDGSWI